ncbi:hypothetical protein HanIR_Chr05g0234771 [Helianthus annuus]|nr:hypothetical protein HanIR_Chr05g0234771 [Helianthus annuus]
MKVMLFIKCQKLGVYHALTIAINSSSCDPSIHPKLKQTVFTLRVLCELLLSALPSFPSGFLRSSSEVGKSLLISSFICN